MTTTENAGGAVEVRKPRKRIEFKDRIAAIRAQIARHEQAIVVLRGREETLTRERRLTAQAMLKDTDGAPE